MDTTVLPTVNALLNSVSAVSLIAGWRFVKRGNVAAHRRCMLTAVCASSLFLCSYLTYHFLHGTTRFIGTGGMRQLYFTILISHTILAATVVPLVGTTLYRISKGQVDKHRRIARWTLPIWLYVSVTGVTVYLMLYSSYPHRLRSAVIP